MRMHLIFPETRVIDSSAYIFVADSVGLALFKFVQRAPKDASFVKQSAFWPFKVVQGHPRSVILVPIESAYMTSFYSDIVTIILSCTVYEIW